MGQKIRRSSGGITDLFEKAAFLDDVGDRLHLYAFCLIYVLESIEFSCLLVLHYSDLGREPSVSTEGR